MNERLRFTPAEAATNGRCHPDTVRRALAAGELHGSQRKKNGRWSIRKDCLEAWLEGIACDHQLLATGSPTLSVVQR